MLNKYVFSLSSICLYLNLTSVLIVAVVSPLLHFYRAFVCSKRIINRFCLFPRARSVRRRQCSSGIFRRGICSSAISCAVVQQIPPVGSDRFHVYLHCSNTTRCTQQVTSNFPTTNLIVPRSHANVYVPKPIAGKECVSALSITSVTA